MSAATMATLVIYAYSSFAASWGPGPVIAKQFEKTCQCHVKIIDAGDGGGLVNRIKLEGDKVQADIVVGLDDVSVKKLKTILGWNVSPTLLDYGPYAFVYNSNIVKTPPQSLDDLLSAEWKGEILIEDPRLSTTGLGFLLWVIKEKGEDRAWDYLKKLKDQIKIVSPSWDLAYGLFKKNQGKLVFSYWTSPAYHIQEEYRHDIKAIAFRNGNYSQREYLVSTPGSQNKDLKLTFMKFILSNEAQETIPKLNYMYPSNKGVKLPPAFNEIGTVKELSPLENLSPAKIDGWLTKWREIFS
jgi:thiamine transport system substrate-binding protein